MITQRCCTYYLLIIIVLLIAACSSGKSDSISESAIDPVVVQLPQKATAEPIHQQAITAMPVAENQTIETDFTTPPFYTIFQAHTLILQAGESLRNRCVEVVFIASLANAGNLTLVGTVTIDAAGNSAYTATPTEELRLVEANGTVNNLFVHQFEGINLESAQSFLKNNYQIDCTGRSENFSLKVTSVRIGDQQEEQVQGWVLVNNQRLEADLIQQSVRVFDLSAGSKYELASGIGGFTLVDGIKISVQQRTEYKMVNVAENTKQVLTFSWTHDGAHYELHDGFWQTAFYNGVRSEPDFWRAEGTLLRNGSSYGELHMKTMPGSFQLILYMSNDEIMLDEWE